ncbi:MAG: agmatine deiminase family protein [Bdellovibrionota bacterium]
MKNSPCVKMPLPAQLGFRMPAEWEEHRATWLSWPHNVETWPGVDISKVEPAWAKMTEALSPKEEVNILAAKAMHSRIRKILSSYKAVEKNVILHDIPTDDAWARDAGPIFIRAEGDGQRQIALVDFEFNKWGGKYPPWDQDNQIPQKVAKIRNCASFTPGIVLEGGSIDTNGKGTVLTTAQCLLNKNRNPSLSKEQIEQILRDYLGFTNILWLGEGIAGDDTDGHIDDIVRFINPTTVVSVVEDDPAEENYKPLQENLKKLKTLKDQDGRPLEIVTLPMPRPRYHTDGLRLPASYANFYIGNGAVLLPVFSDPNDEKAVAILSKLFPGRKVVPVDCTDVIVGLGAIHCVTQQEPK